MKYWQAETLCYVVGERYACSHLTGGAIVEYNAKKKYGGALRYACISMIGIFVLFYGDGISKQQAFALTQIQNAQMDEDQVFKDACDDSSAISGGKKKICTCLTQRSDQSVREELLAFLNGVKKDLSKENDALLKWCSQNKNKYSRKNY